MISSLQKTERLLTVDEVAILLDKTKRSVQMYCKSGKLSAVSIIDNGGEQYRVPEAAVMEFAAQNKINLPNPHHSITTVQGAEPYQRKLLAAVSFDANCKQIFDKSTNIENSLNTSKTCAVEVPEKAKQLALAKYDLLLAWENFRKTYQPERSNLSCQLNIKVATSKNKDRILFLLKNIKITVQESSNLLGISKQAIRKSISENKYKAETATGRGGTRYLVYLSSLPEEKQLEYYDQNKENFAQFPADITAKSEQKAGKYKTLADKEFVEAYNSGLLYSDIYAIVGKISTGSLYRWQKLLGNTKDYTNLIPQYKYNMGEYRTALSTEELAVFKNVILAQNRMNVGKAVTWTRELLSINGIESNSSYASFKRWADDFMKNHYDEWIFAREGRKAYDDKVKPYIMRDYSKIEVGDILVADGHRLDFRVVHPFTGKPVRALIVAYQDMKSGAIAGFEIMVNENTQCVASALRNSIIKLGKMPRICYQDNGKAFKNKFFKGSKNFKEANLCGLFERLGIQAMFSKPYNGKAKIIERFWGEFAGLEKIVPSYVGNNIDNKPAYMRRNEKFHKENHNEFVPTIEQTIVAVERWLEIYHRQPCTHVPDKTIGEVFNEGIGEGVDINLLDDLMMSEELRKVQRNGVKFLGQHYFSPDIHGIKDNVLIRYSLFDITYVKIFSTKGKYICTATVPDLIHPAVHYMGDAKDLKTYKDALKLHDSLERKTVQKVKTVTTYNYLEAGLSMDVIENHPMPVIEDKKKRSKYSFNDEPVENCSQKVSKTVYEF